ncbi:MAG: radical SAM protein [bacterium]
MRILFIYPPWSQIYGRYEPALRAHGFVPPLGLCALAAFMKVHGYKAKIIDMAAERRSIGDIIQEISQYSPDVIGISATSPVFQMAKLTASKIKEKFDIPVAIGGVHVTVVPEEVMQEGKSFDYGIIGEGEITLLELVETLARGDSVNGVKGLIYRDGENVLRTEPRPYIQDLDSLPIPDRTLLNLDRYTFSIPKKGVGKITIMMTNRGCPFQCVFCSARTMWGTRVRWRSVEKVLEEIEHIVNELHIRYINFADDTLTLKRDRMIEICNVILERNVQFDWEGMTRANTVDEELLKLMKKAGLVRLSFGIESGDSEILKKIKKGVTLEEVKRAYKIAHKLGIETRGSVMLGHPYETKRTAMKTLWFIRNLKECMQVYINITTPFPGTELYEMVLKGEGGTRLLTKDLSQYRRYDNAVMEVNDLTKEDLTKLQRLGFIMFFLTIRRIIYNLKRAGVLAGVKNVIGFIKSIWR